MAMKFVTLYLYCTSYNHALHPDLQVNNNLNTYSSTHLSEHDTPGLHYPHTRHQSFKSGCVELVVKICKVTDFANQLPSSIAYMIAEKTNSYLFHAHTQNDCPSPPNSTCAQSSRAHWRSLHGFPALRRKSQRLRCRTVTCCSRAVIVPVWTNTQCAKTVRIVKTSLGENTGGTRPLLVVINTHPRHIRAPKKQPAQLPHIPMIKKMDPLVIREQLLKVPVHQQMRVRSLGRGSSDWSR